MRQQILTIHKHHSPTAIPPPPLRPSKKKTEYIIYMYLETHLYAYASSITWVCVKPKPNLVYPKSLEVTPWSVPYTETLEQCFMRQVCCRRYVLVCSVMNAMQIVSQLNCTTETVDHIHSPVCIEVLYQYSHPRTEYHRVAEFLAASSRTGVAESFSSDFCSCFEAELFLLRVQLVSPAT